MNVELNEKLGLELENAKETNTRLQAIIGRQLRQIERWVVKSDGTKLIMRAMIHAINEYAQAAKVMPELPYDNVGVEIMDDKLYLRIGCQSWPVPIWRDHIDHIARTHGCPDDARNFYRIIVDILADSHGYMSNTSPFNTSGYDLDGFDRDGYSRDGFDCDGFDRDGYSRNGGVFRCNHCTTLHDVR